MPNPPPLPSVSTIPEESDSFIAPSHVEQNGHCTPHDLLFVLYLVFLEGQVFFSDVAAPVAPGIGCALLAILLSCCCFFFKFFLIPFQACN